MVAIGLTIAAVAMVVVGFIAVLSFHLIVELASRYF